MTDTPAWQPIDTAPKEWVHEMKTPAPYNMTLRYGRVIKVRGEYNGQMEEFDVHWAQVEGKHMCPDPHWFVIDDAPLDWPATEWRELTDAEHIEIYGEDAPTGRP